jgi:DNA-binding GntR family transcriptional regulator
VARSPAGTSSDRDKRSPYDLIKDGILEGRFGPGYALVETTLAQTYEVSRTPIREALTRLEQDGLVQRSDRGLIVRERSPEEILDIYETRIVLEATAARVAAARRNQIDLITLRRISDQELNAPVAEQDMAEANRVFHRAVWKATHNESLRDILMRLDLHLLRFPSTTLSRPGRWEESVAEHRQMLDAIEAQDGTLAAEIATKHFTEARDLRLAIWAEAQD